ncbi:unnamed protein product [Prorocentrum cordatum]|uniref:Altered inheritance of mitochondria protein 24, mitochondrial n=1 Tax=Prorocentrum cordatum TaxID=2364126 RepID=A0ABN9RP99_9DINO|nr:unnamed protein product [Polarella glacialis]
MKHTPPYLSMCCLPLLLASAGGLVVLPGGLAVAPSSAAPAPSSQGALGGAGRELAPDGGPGARRAGRRTLGQWRWLVGATSVVLALALAVVQAALFCAPAWPSEPGPSEQARGRRLPCCGRRPGSRSAAAAAASSGSLASASEALSNSLAAASEGSLMRGDRAAAALCAELVVPDGCTLHCGVPEAVCHKRQNTVVSVHSLTVPGGTSLFQARLAECDLADVSGVGIHLETLGGGKKFAFLSTQAIWAAPRDRHCEMEIVKASGAKFATIMKTKSGVYTIARGADTLIVFRGNFAKHDVQVYSSLGQRVAKVGPGDGMYEVVVYTSVDAGLVILGLLAIDKMEIMPT